MKIDILGSGSIGAKNMSACTMIDGHILIDVPNGIVKYMKHLGFSVLDIDTVFITHLHGDHFFDLPFLLFEKYYAKDTKLLQIFCPKGTLEKVKLLFEVGFPGDFEKIMKIISVKFIEFDYEGSFSVDGLDVNMKFVSHGTLPYSFGYLMQKNGKRIAFSGDTSYCEAVDFLVRNSDIAILDMSILGKGDASHMGFLDIQYFCEKYPDKKIVATHMRDSTRTYAKEHPISNLIIPEDHFQINL